MAWTTPLTWASGRIVTAADLNTYIRDNQLQTAGAIFSAQGDILYGVGANEPGRLGKSTTSTQYLSNTGTNNLRADFNRGEFWSCGGYADCRGQHHNHKRRWRDNPGRNRGRR